MRVAGRSGEGLAKPLQTNTDGILKVQNDVLLKNKVDGKGDDLGGWNPTTTQLSTTNPGYFEFKTDVTSAPFYSMEVKKDRKYYLAFDYFADGLAPTSKVVMALRKTSPTADVSNGITMIGSQTSPIRVSEILETNDIGDRLATYRQGVGSYYYFNNLTLIDLTESFGYGNEPTKDDMDNFMKNFPDNYFSEGKYFNLSSYLFNRSRGNNSVEKDGNALVINTFAQEAPDGMQYLRVADIAPHGFDEASNEYMVRVSDKPNTSLIQSHLNNSNLIGDTVMYIGETIRKESLHLIDPIDVSKYPNRTIVIYNHYDQPIKLRTPFYFVDFSKSNREILPADYGETVADIEIPAYNTEYGVPGKALIDGERLPFLNIPLPAMGLDLRRSTIAPTNGHVDVYIFGGN